MTVNHDVVGSSPTGGVIQLRGLDLFFCYVINNLSRVIRGETFFGSIIFVVGKFPMDIMGPILLQKKVPDDFIFLLKKEFKDSLKI